MTGGGSGQQSRHQTSGAATPARGRDGDSGLTAGTDALRLACLGCLEVSSEASSKCHCPYPLPGDGILFSVHDAGTAHKSVTYFVSLFAVSFGK